MQDFSKVCKILFTYLEQSNTNVKQLYPEHKNGFTVLGLDFMVVDNKNTNSLDVKLIECNNNPSFVYFEDKNTDKVSKAYFEWIGKNVFAKLK